MKLTSPFALVFAATTTLAALGCGSSGASGGGGDGGGGGAPQDATTTEADGASSSGGGAQDGGSVPLVDGGTCPSAPWSDPTSAARASCSFEAGTHASDTLGVTAAERAAIPIKHVIVMMKENRAFDHVFGDLKSIQPDVDVAGSTFSNVDLADASVPFFHLTTTCVGFDPDHQWDAMHSQVADGGMSGFVQSAANSTGGDGHFVMGHYAQTDLPFDYFLASTFAIADRYFPSVRSGTFPNRDYLLLGTSDGVQSTQFVTWPSPTLPTIFDELTAAGVTWGVYGDDHPLEETLDDPVHNWATLNPWSPVSKLISDLQNDTLPSVVFVDGTENVDDEHPTADLQVGEAWTKKLYDAAIASKAWSSTAILFTYDEAGGFADHVPPPNSACVARPQDGAFFELGTRVPLITISPWSRRHYVSHVQHEHASISRFIETVFDLPSLTARDANADALLDMFDFGCSPAAIPAAPQPGAGGCGGSAAISVDKPTYNSGDTITVTFSGGPGNAKDWIAVYPRGTSPVSGSTLWNYCNSNTHTAGATGVTSGTVTLDVNSAGAAGNWPLKPGTSWTVYYLLNDGYTAIASVQFDVHS
jgi:phospholipase C